MKGEREIHDELAALKSSLARLPRTMPYALPENYFAEFANKTASLLIQEETKELPWDKQMPFSVPENYFEVLPQKISRLTSEQMTKERMQSVPEGYFEELPSQILAAAKADEMVKAGKIIPFRPFMKWAAAAAIIMLISLGVYQFAFKPNLTPEQRLAKLSAEMINEYVSRNIDDFDTEELIEYSSLATANGETDKVLNNSLDKKDIIDYLNENGWETTEGLN